MALQGTIETFALPEVLRLLGSGAKTGRLRVSGDRGSGSVWIDGGKVVGAEATGSRDGASPVSVVFELLRFVEGSFNFDDDQTNTEPSTPQDIEVLLGDAEHQLAEWREIEAVVPSLAVGLTFVAELPTDEVVVDAKRWTALVAVADGRSVAAIADAMALDELDACRRAKELVEAGLVEITELVEPEPSVDAEVDPVDAMADDPDVALEQESVDASTDNVGEMWAAADEAPAGGGFELVGTDAPGAPPEALGTLDGTSYDTGFAPDSGFAPEGGFAFEAPAAPVEDTRSSARAELDAMASGFGLQDEPVSPGFSPDAGFSSDGSFSTGEFSTGGGGDFGGDDFSAGAFEHGFASDPGDDPAFSFAAPGGENGFGDSPSETSFDTGASLGSGAALFADDVVTAAPPSSGLNGSDGLFAAGTSDFDGPADDSGDAAEVARQLANLSPKAARAVAAAARASTAEEREAALAEVTSEGDEPINRGLLLKFLSSVQT